MTLRVTVPRTPARSPELRIFGRVVAGRGGCVIWTGAVTREGYGKVRFNGRDTTPHRAAYALTAASVPDGLEVDHLCHTRDASCPGGPTCLHRRCVNPYHLEPVTPRENTLRSPNSPPGANSRRSECPEGHPYDDENTRIRPAGHRECKTCARDSYEKRLEAPARPPTRETCYRGHPLTEDNIVRRGAVLTCRTCRRASQARYREAQRARRAQAKEAGR